MSRWHEHSSYQQCRVSVGVLIGRMRRASLSLFSSKSRPKSTRPERAAARLCEWLAGALVRLSTSGSSGCLYHARWSARRTTQRQCGARVIRGSTFSRRRFPCAPLLLQHVRSPRDRVLRAPVLE